MCRHCDRINEDLDSKPIVHAFMADLAAKMSRNTGVALTADDLELKIEVAWAKQRLIIERKMRGDTGTDGRPIPGTIEPMREYGPTEGSEISSQAAARIMSNSGPFT